MRAETTCAECGRCFTPRLSTARYCSSRCRLLRHRASRPAMPARGGETADGAFLSVSGYPTTQPRGNGIGETLRAPQARALPRGIVPDANWPGMYRVQLADGTLSDMLNLTRARDLLRIVEGAG